MSANPESDANVPRDCSRLPVVQFWEREKVDSLFLDLKLAPDSLESVALWPNQGTKYENIVLSKERRLFFLTSDQQVVSIYRSIILNKKADLWSTVSSEEELIRRVNFAALKTVWTIFLIGGGHFAGAIFSGSEIIAHKTFHNYTVRAKQGGTQSSKDNSSANHPKSAGASLRRYNEMSHKQHIQEILSDWKEHIHGCHLIFFRCPVDQRHILYNGKSAPLKKGDKRIRMIPFVTGRATLKEIKSIHQRLFQIILHGDLETLLQRKLSDAVVQSRDESPMDGNFAKDELSVDSKAAEGEAAGPVRRKHVTARRETMDSKASRDTREIGESTNDTESESDEWESDLITEVATLTLDHLNPYGSTVEDLRREMKRQGELVENDNVGPIPNIANERKEKYVIENSVYTACRTGNLPQLKALLKFSRTKDFTEVSDTLSADVIEAVLQAEESIDLRSLKFGSQGKTLLHLAADGCHKDLMWWLLESGCDPRIKNDKGETPYIAAKNKEARNHFRRYMAAYPHQYDYEEAKIPGPLTKQMERDAKARNNLKKKEKQKAKVAREKKLQEEERIKREEEEEREKFQALSDREKRALAAEFRRDQPISNPETNQLILRCHQCGRDISRLIPFDFMDFLFCSTLCVQEQRKSKKAT